jgi:hypothetical protein
VDRVSIYEESLKENVAALTEQRKRTFVPRTSSGGAEPTKRAAMGNQSFQRSFQGCAPAVLQNQP